MPSRYNRKTLLQIAGFALLILMLPLHAAEIRDHLDSDAEFYFHTKKQLDQPSGELLNCSETLTVLHEIASDAGIYSINGFGYSRKILNGGVIRRKLFLSEKQKTENAQYLLWDLMNDPVFPVRERAALFPENALTASTIQLDAAQLLEFAKAQFRKHQRVTMLKLIQSAGAVLRKCGFAPADLLDTYARECSIAAVPDPGAEHSLVPFSLVCMVKIKEERFFRMFTDKIPSFLIQRKEGEGKNFAFVVPIPWTRFSFCLAKHRGNVIFTTSLPLMEHIFTAEEQKKTLAGNPDFQTLASALSPECNAFTYTSPEFLRLMKQSGRYPQWALNLFTASGLCPAEGTLAAAQRLPDGILSERVTLQNQRKATENGTRSDK